MPGHRTDITWSQRLGRVFGIDIEACAARGGRLRIIACIEDPAVIEKILAHIGGKGSYARSESVAALSESDITPETAILWVRDHDLVHAHRTGKHGELDRDWYANLPLHLRAPQGVLLDRGTHAEPALLYVYPALDGQADKLVIQLRFLASSAQCVEPSPVGRSLQTSQRKGYAGPHFTTNVAL